MIRINLLPVKRSKRRDAAARELIVGAIILGVVLVGLYVWYAVMESNLTALDEKIAAVEKLVKDKEQEIVKVDEFKKKKRELESKVAVIEDLKAKKTGPVKMLDELAINMPRRVWLVTFDEKGGAMTLDGGAADNDDLSDFLTYLTTNSKYFNGVTLSFSETVPAANGLNGYVRFKITGSAQYGTLPVVAAGGPK